MSNWLPLIALAVLIICGVWTCFLEGMVFGFVAERFKDSPKWWQKPLFLCPPCMSSVQGTLIFVLAIDGPLWQLPLFVFAVCGATKITFELIFE